jgi:hypothetical protein
LQRSAGKIAMTLVQDHMMESALCCFYIKSHPITCPNIFLVVNLQKLIGLIFDAVPDKTETYQRTGMFEHSHGTETSEDYPAMFPGFTDFDVDNFGREAITII